MGAKAKRDKTSILADAKNFLKILLPAIQRMPKIERHEGAAVEMKNAAFSIVSNFTTAYYCPEVRVRHIQLMFGDYGKLLAAFEIAIQQGLLTDSLKLALAMQLERIEEGIEKWHKWNVNVQKVNGLASGACAGHENRGTCQDNRAKGDVGTNSEA